MKVSLRHVHKELKKYRKPGTKSQVKVFLHLSRRVYHKFRIIWTFILVSNFFFFICVNETSSLRLIPRDASRLSKSILLFLLRIIINYQQRKKTRTQLRGGIWGFFFLFQFLFCLYGKTVFFLFFQRERSKRLNDERGGTVLWKNLSRGTYDLGVKGSIVIFFSQPIAWAFSTVSFSHDFS